VLMRPIFNWSIMRQIDRHFPGLETTQKKVEDRGSLLLSNTNPVFGFIRPLVPSTISLGFMHIEPSNELPDGEVKQFLDNSSNGVIYMSLGSHALSADLDGAIIQMLLNVFKSLQLSVLWKFEADNLPNKPDNVLISKWLPQADVLAHRNVKLFITHGGHMSMEEAIDRAVPMLVMPLMFDQGANAAEMVNKQVAVALDLNQLTERALAEAIDEVTKPKYRRNIQKLRELVYDQPMTSREKAVWWTEYVIRHKGADHLKYQGRLVPFYQRFGLDIMLVLLASIYIIRKLLLIRIRIRFYK